MNAFHSRLRQLSATCEFDDVDKEIKSQIFLSCSSQRVQCKALRDATMTLETLLNEARALEISERKQRISNRQEMRLMLCFLLHHHRRKIVSIVVKFGHKTQRRVVLCEIASAMAVINMVTMRNAAHKSRMRPEIPKKESIPVDMVIPRKRKNNILTDWKQNVRNVRPCQALMTSIHSS